MPKIHAIRFRRVLNSHVDFTTEFIVELEDHTIGCAASPQGETISIYEDRKIAVDPAHIIQRIAADGMLYTPLDQESWDQYLRGHMPVIGRNNAFGLSLAFFEAHAASRDHQIDRTQRPACTIPRLCLNIINGGQYAYTNPVLSDFPEYLLVARSRDIPLVIEQHSSIQRMVRDQLIHREKTVINGNPVSRFATTDNRECIDFLLNILNSLHLEHDFDLMIDASATDLRTEHGYCFPVTTQAQFTSDEFLTYWLELIQQYQLPILEDPFHEEDTTNWHALTTQQTTSKIIGDNFYTSEAGRIVEGAQKQWSHGVLIKPNQAGTVTAVRQAIEAAQAHGQIAITSHRSISTESTFLSWLTCVHHVDSIKIGPLMTDYSSVLRLNAILRLTMEET